MKQTRASSESPIWASTRAPARKSSVASSPRLLAVCRSSGWGSQVTRVADAPEAVRAGGLERLQDRLDPLAQVQVGVADDGRGGPLGP